MVAPGMRVRRTTAIAMALALTLCAAALAAAVAKPSGEYFFRKIGHFSITLTAKAGKSIVSGKPAGVSSVLVVCPKSSSGAFDELQLGFPGVRLKVVDHHYHFSLTYTEKHANLVAIEPVFGHVTHERATATVTGTVKSAKLIAGTVQVHGNGCNLASSSYSARSAKV
jgi:hypothetical protein